MEHTAPTMTRPDTPDPAQDRIGRTIPERLAALLHVVRVLLGHGRRLVETVPHRVADVEFAIVAGVCGTYTLPTILVRLQRGILRAMALERYLLARAAKGREIGFVYYKDPRERMPAKPAAEPPKGEPTSGEPAAGRAKPNPEEKAPRRPALRSGRSPHPYARGTRCRGAPPPVRPHHTGTPRGAAACRPRLARPRPPAC